jgi:hypothetical protein
MSGALWFLWLSLMSVLLFLLGSMPFAVLFALFSFLLSA